MSGADVAVTSLEAVILGLVEGVTEFIPVSSTGHLIVVGMARPGGRAGQDVRHLHPARRDPGHRLALSRSAPPHRARGARTDPASRRFLLNLAIAFLPAAVVGFLIHDWIKERLFNTPVVAVGAGRRRGRSSC